MSLSSFLSDLSLLPQVAQLVDDTVKQIETALSGLPGTAKFAAAEAKVNAVLSAVVADAQVLSSLQGILGTLINAAVAAFNAAGIFAHAAAADVPATAGA